MNKTRMSFMGLTSLCILLTLAAKTQNPPRLAVPNPGAVKRYKIVRLPLQPLGLSESGEIVGKTDSGHPAVWSRQEGLRELPRLDGFPEGQASAINGLGEVVGFVTATNPGRSQAFLYRNGRLVPLAGERSKALAINDAGQIVGESAVRGKIPTTPVLWKDGSVIDLGSCCGGTAVGINRQGFLVGNVYDEQGRYRAFLWDQFHGTHLLGEAGSYSAAVAINDQGHVVVQEFDKGVFLYEPDRSTRVAPSITRALDARGMNNRDSVVGTFTVHADLIHAFIWTKEHGFQDLNDLAGDSRWMLEVANGINDHGEIVGWGDFDNTEDVGFLLIPE